MPQSRLPGDGKRRSDKPTAECAGLKQIEEGCSGMKFFPREKHRIDFVGLATRREKNPWLAKFYLALGILFFGYVFYTLLFGS